MKANRQAGEFMDQQLKSNLTSSKHWIRLVYMLLFACFLYVASFVIVVLVIVQFVFALVTGSDNKKLREFGSSLTQYIYQVLLFLTFNSEEKAFPFTDWPAPASQDVVEIVDAADVTATNTATANGDAPVVIVPSPDTGILKEKDDGPGSADLNKPA